MTKTSIKYDLEDRTLKFSKDVRQFLKRIPKSIPNFEDSKQLIRSSGSVGANYIEANEALSKKDFIHRVKISRKESKESRYWLNIIEISNEQELVNRQKYLINESQELMNIFGAIINKCQ